MRDPYPSANLPLSWPDFSNLDPANSPQTIIEGGRPVRQEVTVNGDILTVIWKLGYKEDGTYYFTAFVSFPEGYDVSTITDTTCDGAPAYNTQYNKGKNEMILKFRRDQVTEQTIDTNFVITGHFGAGMVFEGSDEILKVVE